jgi:hypothetical protein
LRDASWAQEVGRRHARAGRFQAKPGKTLEDNASEIVPVADQISEHAYEQRLLRQPSNDVLVSRPAPEYCCKGDIDRGERRRQERHFAAE